MATGRLCISGEAERLLAEAGALYAEALEAGYRGALHLHGSCADAHVGAAEAHVALGKLAAAGTDSLQPVTCRRNLCPIVRMHV